MSCWIFTHPPTHPPTQARAFLEVLEAPLLTGQLPSISPLVLTTLLEHYLERGEGSTGERCLLAVQGESLNGLDFDHVLGLLRRHKLYTGLAHLYTRGLLDYLSPIKVRVYGTAKRERETSHPPTSSSSTNPPSHQPTNPPTHPLHRSSPKISSSSLPKQPTNHPPTHPPSPPWP